MTTYPKRSAPRPKVLVGYSELRWAKRSPALRVVKDDGRPQTRGDCAGGPRPCPWVSCRHHLYLDVDDNGSVKLNFPHLEPDQLKESCSLDVADRMASMGSWLQAVDVGDLVNVNRERVRQIEFKALRKLINSAGHLVSVASAAEPSGRRSMSLMSRVLQAVTRQPGSTMSEVGSRLGLTPLEIVQRNVSRALWYLTKRGKVRTEGKHMEKRFFPVSP